MDKSTSPGDDFWTKIDLELRASTVNVYTDTSVEIRLVNNSDRLELIIRSASSSKSIYGRPSFDWYTMVAGGALMTAAKFILNRETTTPQVKTQREGGKTLFAILTETRQVKAIDAKPSGEPYAPHVLSALIWRIAGTLNRATG